MRHRRVVVLFSESEKRLLEERAARVGLTLSCYLRTLFLEHDGPVSLHANQVAEAS
jgi:hypothetical protein